MNMDFVKELNGILVMYIVGYIILEHDNILVRLNNWSKGKGE